MSVEIEERLNKIPLLRNFVNWSKSVKLNWLSGLSLYDLLELYIIGLTEGALSNRAGAIAFSFFMALFPFALFILNLIPFIPIEGFQEDLYFDWRNLNLSIFKCICAESGSAWTGRSIYGALYNEF